MDFTGLLQIDISVLPCDTIKGARAAARVSALKSFKFNFNYEIRRFPTEEECSRLKFVHEELIGNRLSVWWRVEIEERVVMAVKNGQVEGVISMPDNFTVEVRDYTQPVVGSSGVDKNGVEYASSCFTNAIYTGE